MNQNPKLSRNRLSFHMEQVTTTTQTIHMTLQMIQSLDILSWTNLELMEFLKAESLENPTIEISFNECEVSPYSGHSHAAYKDKEEDQDPINYVEDDRVSMFDYLDRQLHLLHLTEKDQEIGRFLINMLDHDGHLDQTAEELADQICVSVEEMQIMICVMQTLEPVGLFTRSAKDSLLVQAEAKGYPPFILQMIREDLKNIAEHYQSRLLKKYQLTLPQLEEAIQQILELDPHPANQIMNTDSYLPWILPDLTLEYDRGSIRLNFMDQNMPQVGFQDNYISLYINGGKEDKEVKSYLKEKMKRTGQIIRAINKRKVTLTKVAEAICLHQLDFLIGQGPLIPLKLEDIAKELDLHISTVSRAIKGKILQTQGGYFELKSLFTNEISRSGQSSISSHTVVALIKLLIDQEDPKHPLSDQTLASLLQSHHIKIARRTVTKYRMKMGIEDSQKRKYK